MTSECNSHDSKYSNDMINNGTMTNDAVLLFRGKALWGKFRSFWDINNSLSHELGSERVSEQVSGASEQANRQASGPALKSVLLVVLAQSARLRNFYFQQTS